MARDLVTLFLCGDVMSGRGVDQILAHPCDPTLREGYVLDARTYVGLAEEVSGAIPRRVSPAYVWGDALAELTRVGPSARIVNLETSITHSDAFWPAKAVNYRMSPENAACLAAAELDVCALANNHVIDFGLAGLEDTLATLDAFSIGHAGAGSTLDDAQTPAVIDLGELGRVLVLSVASVSSGVPPTWAATRRSPGVCLLADLSPATVRRIRGMIEAHARARDVVVLSIHWGPNWGYDVTPEERRFAHALVDHAGAHVVHGHSSHHPKGIELHEGRLILYGCGDFLTDYEGIRGNELFRGELGAMYFPSIDPASGRLEQLEIVPTRVRRLQVTRAGAGDARWLGDVMTRESAVLGTVLEQSSEGHLHLR